MKTVGVLALQGGVEEHLHILNEIKDINPVSVRYVKDLENLDGLIMPGGESTTLGKLLRSFEMLEPLKRKIKEGLPVWGTCAGMILLAKHIEGEEEIHLGVMDICVKRNAYGRQLGSFKTEEIVKEIDNKALPLVFIRAPYVTKVNNNVQVLLKVNDKIVACKQGNILATAFHPELTKSKEFHQYFIKRFIGDN